MASLFGEQSGDEIDKFERVQWSVGPAGVPILSECVAWIAGPVIDRMNGGDHEAFLISAADGGGGTHESQFMWSDASEFEPGHPE